jgi:hypothetical protein
MKSIYIRCNEEVAELAKALAEKENRSVNKQIIYMIMREAEAKNISILPREEKIERAEEPVIKKHAHGLESWSVDANGSPVESTVGLRGLVGKS